MRGRVGEGLAGVRESGDRFVSLSAGSFSIVFGTGFVPYVGIPHILRRVGVDAVNCQGFRVE